MRIITMLGVGFSVVAMGMQVEPAAAAKSKMGCEIGSEVWSASEGKCVPGTPKYAKRGEAKATPKAAPKAAPKKTKNPPQ